MFVSNRQQPGDAWHTHQSVVQTAGVAVVFDQVVCVVRAASPPPPKYRLVACPRPIFRHFHAAPTKARSPRGVEPTGALRPLERQKETESAPRTQLAGRGAEGDRRVEQTRPVHASHAHGQVDPPPPRTRPSGQHPRSDYEYSPGIAASSAGSGYSGRGWRPRPPPDPWYPSGSFRTVGSATPPMAEAPPLRTRTGELRSPRRLHRLAVSGPVPDSRLLMVPWP